MPSTPPPEMTDETLAEIDVLTTLIIAVSGVGRPLTNEELDAALGVTPGAGAGADKPAATASGEPGTAPAGPGTRQGPGTTPPRGAAPPALGG